MAVGTLPAAAAPGAPGAERADSRMEGVERLFERVSNGLTRWLGPYGVHALMARAIARVRPTHPALAGVTIAPASDLPDRPRTYLTGWQTVMREHGEAAAMDGATAVLESLAEQMGRLIGDGLATTLLEQSATMPGAPASVVYSGGARGARGTPAATTTAIDPPREAEPLHDVLPPDGES